MSDETEIPLSGGNVNEQVVKVGDTVRRVLSPSSANVHKLLKHLETAGYTHAPQFLGIDDKGREILSFISGSTDFPPDIWSNQAVPATVAKMLRAYHDITKDIDLGPKGWAYAHPDPVKREVICHNDFAPYNMVFDDGLPVAIFDFDLAGPGPRLRDLAYLSYWIAPLSFAAGDMKDASEAEVKGGCPRLKSICETYGTTDYTGLLNMVSEMLAHMASFDAAQKMIGETAAQKLVDEGHLDHWRGEATAFEANKSRVLMTLLNP